MKVKEYIQTHLKLKAYMATEEEILRNCKHQVHDMVDLDTDESSMYKEPIRHFRGMDKRTRTFKDFWKSPSKLRTQESMTDESEKPNRQDSLDLLSPQADLDVLKVTQTCNLSMDTLHRRLNHTCERTIRYAIKHGLMQGLEIDPNSKLHFCEGCRLGKQTRKPYPRQGLNEKENESEPGESDVKDKKPIGKKLKKGKKYYRSEPKRGVLDLVHMDLIGPFEVQSLTGKRYILHITDDASRYSVVYFLRNKSDSFEAFRQYAAEMEAALGRRIKRANLWSATPHNLIKGVRSDNDGSFTAKAFKKWMHRRGILHQITTRDSPQENGRAERYGRTLIESTRCLLFQAGLSKGYYNEAASVACFIKNRLPHRAIGMSPYEAFFGEVPRGDFFKTFGCICYAKPADEQMKKLDARGRKSIFLGYHPVNQRYYRIMDLKTRRKYYSRDVDFNETQFLHHQDVPGAHEVLEPPAVVVQDIMDLLAGEQPVEDPPAPAEGVNGDADGGSVVADSESEIEEDDEPLYENPAVAAEAFEEQKAEDNQQEEHKEEPDADLEAQIPNWNVIDPINDEEIEAQNIDNDYGDEHNADLQPRMETRSMARQRESEARRETRSMSRQRQNRFAKRGMCGYSLKDGFHKKRKQEPEESRECEDRQREDEEALNVFRELNIRDFGFDKIYKALSGSLRNENENSKNIQESIKWTR